MRRDVSVQADYVMFFEGAYYWLDDQLVWHTTSNVSSGHFISSIFTDMTEMDVCSVLAAGEEPDKYRLFMMVVESVGGSVVNRGKGG